jgi:hypothetical protein
MKNITKSFIFLTALVFCFTTCGTPTMVNMEIKYAAGEIIGGIV